MDAGIKNEQELLDKLARDIREIRRSSARFELVLKVIAALLFISAAYLWYQVALHDLTL